jgi:hypothetical protein
VTDADERHFRLLGDIILLDRKEPTDSATALGLSAAEVGRRAAGVFYEERIVASAWPASENRIAVIELTY